MTFISTLASRGKSVKVHRPWPRIVVNADVWRDAIAGLREPSEYRRVMAGHDQSRRRRQPHHARLRAQVR